MQAAPALFVSVALLSACATYQPPQLPREKVAVLSLHPPGGMRQIEFREIDGKPLSTASALSFTRARGPVALAPGKHTIKVLFKAHFLTGTADLWLVAEPNKTYALHCETASGATFRSWIEDTATGQAVGGHVGSPDEPL